MEVKLMLQYKKFTKKWTGFGIKIVSNLYIDIMFRKEKEIEESVSY